MLEKTGRLYFSRRNGLPPRSLPPVKIFAGGAGEGAFYKRLHHGMWLFHPHSAVKMQPFYPIFPVAESTANVFCWLFLWSCKEKSINHFLWYSLPFPAGTDSRRTASPPAEIFAGGGPGEGAFYKKRPPPPPPPPVLPHSPYSIQFAARPTARCQLWSSSARRASSIAGSKRRSSFQRVDTSSSLSQKPTASPAR